MEATRILRPAGPDTWDVLVDEVLIGRVVRRVEPGLNDRGPSTVIRGVALDGRDTIRATDLRHAATMIFNGWQRRQSKVTA